MSEILCAPIGLLFSGQGAQAVGMGKSFYENSSTARQLWDLASDTLGYDLKKIAFDGPAEALMETRVCQSALYVHGYAIYAELRNLGYLAQLKVALGSSLGELTASAAAGVWNFQEGLKVVAKRAELMQAACEASSGAMTALIGGNDALAEGFAERFDVDISNFNSPGQTVLSGDREKIAAATAAAKEGGFKLAVPLVVAGAYHSRLMIRAQSGFAQFIKDIPFAQPAVPVIANVCSCAFTDPERIREALVKQIVSPVRWTQCMLKAKSLGVTHFIECGPGAVLAGLARRIDKELQVLSINEFKDLDKVNQ